MRTSLVLLLFCLLSCILCGRALAQQSERGGAVEATLVADTSAIVPGKPFRIGLYLRMLPGWHTYWQYPGDVGLPTTIKWDLPSGFRIGPFQWPIPKRITLAGDIVDYGYDGETLLIAEVQPPIEIHTNKIVLQGKANWLVCAKLCVPGEANVSLTLPVEKSALPKNGEIFNRFDQQLPAPCPSFPVTVSQFATGMQITAQPGPEVAKLSFYPLPVADQKIGKISETPPSDGQKWWVIKVPTVGNLRGVLVTESKDGSRYGYSLNEVPPCDSVDVLPTKQTINPPKTSSLTLWQGIFYGFLGGLILNLMPCVFPVISLKIFGFVRQAGEKRRSIFHHGLAFTAGVFTWFFALAAGIIFLQRRGHEALWAFQFQNPAFIFVILAIVFVFALNLLGVFEIYLPGSATTQLARWTELQGLSGSFFQGIFATLLATPCTAPFLGAALGFALSQDTTVIFSVFASIALGLALPYLLLSAQTGWMRFLPRPGVWMERVKQFMAFPLLATAVWLLMILGSQHGLPAVVAALVFLLCLAFCCWLIGAFVQTGIIGWGRRLLMLALLGIIAVVAFFTWPTRMDPHAAGILWRPYSKAALQEALDAGKPVFVDFTADWCLTCKFNEKTAIERPAVRAVFRARHIVAFKADWTKKNPEITEALRSFGRAGVPLYVFYPAGKQVPPVILPEILTESILLKSLSVK
ncbi:MAG: thiol:disulfide interchange protein [Verrucomicrobia bacterium]|nr:MAG: thiol:disulfide interchange protein [Verrucomicrobiota bacterium]